MCDYMNLRLLLVATILTFHSVSVWVSASDPTKQCKQDWPELELLLPVTLNNTYRIDEWKHMFLYTFLMFWPIKISNTKLLIMLDEEEMNSTHVGSMKNEINSHQLLHHRTRILSNDVPGIYYDDLGWKRQQYIMMYADNYTNAEYVGFVDTDCMFITYVHSSDIFENGKPVINGKTGNPYQLGVKEEPIWKEIMYTTYNITGILEPMKCMSYWPVVIRTQHIKEFRSFLEKRYNLPFYEIMRLHISKLWFGQFDLFCAYLFHHHHDEYVWYVHNISPGWDFSYAFEGMETNGSIYTPEMYYPKPRVAIHARFHVPYISYNSTEYNSLLQVGTCMSPPFPKVDPLIKLSCKYYKSEYDYKTKVNADMFRFEKYNFYKAYSLESLVEASYERQKRLNDCPHAIGSKSTQDIFHRPLLEEGAVYYTDFTDAALFVCYNQTLHGFANWDVFVSRGLESKPRQKLVAAQYYLFATGDTLT